MNLDKNVKYGDGNWVNIDSQYSWKEFNYSNGNNNLTG